MQTDGIGVARDLLELTSSLVSLHGIIRLIDNFLERCTLGGVLCDKVFDRLFEEAEIAKFTPQEMREYEASKKAYRDIKNSIDTAKQEGLAEGLEIGMAKGIKEGMEKGRAEGKHEANTETAQRLLAMGLSAEQVAKATQLSLEIIKNLSNS